MVTPEQFVAILGAVTTAIVAIAGVYVQLHQLHAKVNGRLTELLVLTRAAALAEGKLEGLGHPPAGAEPPPLAPPAAP
jgi:hypothetical protein